MTNKQILIQFLHNTTGESESMIALGMTSVMRSLEARKSGSTASFHKEFSPEETEIVLHQMRGQRDMIVHWFTLQLQLELSQ